MRSVPPVLTWLRGRRQLRPAPEAASAVAAVTVEAPARPWGRRLREGLSLPALRRSWSDVLLQPGQASPAVGARVGRRAFLIEWSLIAVLVMAYCAGFLQFGADLALTGNEAEVFQVNSWVLTNTLRAGAFPLWNPYLRAGVPFVGDPMLHIYNPLTSLPVLLWGVVNGFRLALFLSVLAAGWGMWYLGKVLGLDWPARLWVALMYAFAGPPVAKFVQGHYLFVFGFAWIPWAFAGLLAVLQTRRRRQAALAVGALALLFFSGNVYYAYYMLAFVAVLSPVLVLVRRPSLRVDWRRAQVLALIGIVAFGLIAIQFLPLAEFWPHINKATNTLLTDSQTLRQVLLDFTSREIVRADAVPALMPEEYYAYSGWWPFLALALLPLAAWKRDRRPLVLFGLILASVFLWIDLRDMPWRNLYLRVPLLVEFRYPTRTLIYGACALIILAGLALDTAWRLAAPRARRVLNAYLGRSAQAPAERGAALVMSSLAFGAAALMLLFAAWSVKDVYQVNKRLAHLRDAFALPAQVAAWLRSYDPSVYYVGDFSNWHAAWVSNGMRYLDAWLYYGDVREFSGMENRRQVEARPAYFVLTSDRAPDPNQGQDQTVLQSFGSHVVYKLPHSLPYAFVVSQAALTGEGQDELRREEVAPLTPYIPNPNRVELIAESAGGDFVVALSALLPGWRLTVDGHSARVRNVGGFLAAAALPGTHQYVFEYRPTSFYFGLVISLLCLGLTAHWLRSDWPYRWADVQADLRAAAQAPVWRRARARWAAGGGWTVEALGWRLQMSRISAQPVERVAALGTILFVLSLGVYAVTRLWGLDRFPIYFFADETANVLYAEQLIAHGFRDAAGHWFPLYFEAAGLRWTPLLSVYVHALSLALFGKSLLVTRATSAVVSLLGTAAVGLTLKEVFHARFWWTGVLLLALTPAWFLHSRTAFETVMMCSFYAGFLLCYLLYRTRSPGYLYPALVLAAMTFYTYSNGQTLIGATAVLLLLSDLRYHWQQRATLARALPLAGVLALPLILFLSQHNAAFGDHLHQINSYLVQKVPLGEKVRLIASTYLYALSPQYLFLPNNHDIPRHIMLGYGHLGVGLLPLVLLGLGLCAWRWRSSPHRAVVLSALAAPVGAALVGVGITRVLALTISASLLAAVGLEAILSWLADRLAKLKLPQAERRAPVVVALAAFVALAVPSANMLRDALTNGPLWFRDYGLYGMQYGARQLFVEALPRELAADAALQIAVSPNWANGADAFVRFFLTPEQQRRVTLRSLDYYLFEQRDLSNTLLVLTPSEYEAALASDKLKVTQVRRIVPYPDGTPGFYFVTLAYADSAAEIFRAEAEARRLPVEEPFDLDGQTVAVRHSRFGAGSLSDLFDGDRFSLVRGLEANPLMIEITFPQPRRLSGVSLDLGAMASFSVTVTLTTPRGSAPLVFSQAYQNLPDDPHVSVDFNAGGAALIEPVSVLRLEVKNLLSGDTAQIHVREVALH